MDIMTTQRPIDHAVLDPAVSAYDHPDQVLRDDALTITQKRGILASWACDANAVESQPWLRLIPGAGKAVPLSAILDALRRLDERDPPPRGGAAIRLRSANPGAEEFTAPTMIHQYPRRGHGLAKRRHPVRSIVLPELRRADAARADRCAAGAALRGVRTPHLSLR
ncbi:MULTISPECIES: hypothetical protein [Rhodopseudomonas]|uniref:hypothetical protein n=1 Tax=Rhodopseudomonas TaxID=1073 RepID=UPI0009BAE87B|nr:MULTISPECIES: hypothetical protein [Rhodopseudomonas]MDF3809197.1 hypothetical protein [Rhodopseudomonas sp. BAL398]WOK19117.1 hypothetical protein RBJ75_06245 [Rhodopseudomonas sp. BAL398]